MQFFCTCICICNILHLLRDCRTHWSCVRLTITLWIMFTIVIVFTIHVGLMRNSHWCYSQLLFWSSFYTIWCWTHLTGTDTCSLLCISMKKTPNYLVKIVKCIIVFLNILNEIYSDLFLWWYLKTKMDVNEVYCRFILCGFRPSACLQVQTDSPALKRFTMVQEEEKSRSLSLKRASTGSITFSVNIQCDLIIVHPGAVMSILHLLPAAELEGQLIVSMDQRCTKKNDV